MNTQEPRSATAAARRFAFKSINQKVIASVALLLIIGLGGLVAYQSHTSRVLALNTFDDSNAILSRTLADNMTSSVKYAREEALINSYKEISQNPRAGLDGIMVSMADGKVLNSFAQPGFDAGLLKGFVESNKLPDDQNIVIVATDSDTFVMVPVTYGPQRDRIGSLAVAWSRKAVMSEIAADTKNSALISIGIVAMLVVALYLLLRTVVIKPTGVISDAMTKITHGEFDFHLDLVRRHDEIGTMARAVGVFRENALRVHEMSLEQERMKVEAEQKRTELVCSMANDFDNKMVAVLDKVSQSAEQMSAFSRVMAEKMSEAEKGTTEIVCHGRKPEGFAELYGR